MLKPLLAAPTQTWELLLGMRLASLVPAIVISWGAALIFVLALRLVVLSDQVCRVILSGGWRVLLLLGSPLLALLTVAAIVAVSGRVNDPRTAQQVTAVVVVPILALFVAQLPGVAVLTPLLAFIASAALAFLAALAFAGAVTLFERENILTRCTSWAGVPLFTSGARVAILHTVRRKLVLLCDSYADLPNALTKCTLTRAAF